MSTPKTFYELARVNTGAHFLDSGGAYGRHHEKPPVPEDHPVHYARRWGDGYYDIDLLVNQPSALEEAFAIDPKATHAFRLWAQIADPHDDHNWIELAKLYCVRMVETGRWNDPELADVIRHQGREMGVRSVYADNSYNHDNALDQDFEIIAPNPYEGWALIMSHNGCDIRGGYSPPIVAFGEGADYVEDDIRPYCQTCHAEADGLCYVEEKGWRVRRLPTKAILACPNGHIDTYPTFPYVDDMGPEPNRTEPHDPKPSRDGSYCEFCGSDIEEDPDTCSCRCVMPELPIGVPREQLPLREQKTLDAGPYLFGAGIG